MAGWTGLEPATSGLTGQRSNQLNYHPVEIVLNNSDLLIPILCKQNRLVGGTGLEPVTPAL
jgi:hypothetical protein